MMNGDLNFNIECWYKPGCSLYAPMCHKTCHRYLEMNFLITNCGQPDAHRYIKQIVPDKNDIKAYKRLDEIKTNVVSFVSNGSNLYIVSEKLRNGKTTWALKIMYRYFDEIWAGNGFNVRGYFVHVPELLTRLKTYSYRETEEYKYMDYNIKNSDLVVWDDISSMELYPNDQNILNTYIGRRLQNSKSNIFTGYKLGEALKSQVGELLSKRIQSSEIVEFVCDGRTPEENALKVAEQIAKKNRKTI